MLLDTPVDAIAKLWAFSDPRRSDMQVWSWGWNDRGTLGLGHQSKEMKPKRIAALKGVRIKQVQPPLHAPSTAACLPCRPRERLRP